MQKFLVFLTSLTFSYFSSRELLVDSEDIVSQVQYQLLSSILANSLHNMTNLTFISILVEAILSCNHLASNDFFSTLTSHAICTFFDPWKFLVVSAADVLGDSGGTASHAPCSLWTFPLPSFCILRSRL